jgi:hypothetical protein
MDLENRIKGIANNNETLIAIQEAFSQPTFNAAANYRDLPYLKDDLTSRIADFIIRKNPSVRGDFRNVLYQAINKDPLKIVIYGKLRGGEHLPDSLMSALTPWESVYLLAGLNEINNEFKGNVSNSLMVEHAEPYEIVSYALRVGMDAMKEIHYSRKKDGSKRENDYYKRNQGKYVSDIVLPEEDRIRSETMHIDTIKNNVRRRYTEKVNVALNISEPSFMECNAMIDDIANMKEAYRLGRLDEAMQIDLALKSKVDSLPKGHHVGVSYNKAKADLSKKKQIEFF